MGCLSESSTYSTRQPQHQNSRVRPYCIQIQKSSPCSSKMAKITILSLLLIALLTLVIITVVYAADSETETASQARSRTRSKPAARKKKPTVSKVKLPEPEVATTLLPTIEEAINTISTLNTGASGLLPSSQESPGREVDTPTEISTQPPLTPQKVSIKANRNPPRQNVPEGCGECYEDDCSTPSDSTCPTGLVMDRCSCCRICGALEGNRCYNASLNLSYNLDIGVCGPLMNCILRSDLDPSEPREALCECQDRRVVCGSDQKTYLSPCKLREAAHSKPGLVVSAYQPCVTAPIMTTPVENATVPIGEDVSMSCEVRAYPASILHWEFVAEGSNGQPLILPGDDSGIVVVVRGGPEQMMTTSWIQIISANPKRQGIYFCVAKNTAGMTKTAAEVKVYKRVDGDDDDDDRNQV